MLLKKTPLLALFLAEALLAQQNYTLSQSGLTGVGANLGIYNVKESGAKGDGTTDDTSALNAALTAAATAGQVAYMPAGTYLVTSPLELTGSMRCAEGAVIKANASITSVINVGSSTVVTDGYLTGCSIDTNNLATNGIWVRQGKHFSLNSDNVYNVLTYGLHVGDSTATFTTYETIVHNFHTRRISSTALVSGSTCLYVDNGTDGYYSTSILVGCDIGMTLKTGGNFVSDVHAWTVTGGSMTVAFDDYSVGNFYKGCEADSPTVYGIHVRNNNASIQGCRFYLNPAYSTDNTAIGIKFDTASAYASVQGNIFQGGDGTHRWATDISITGTSNLSTFGNQEIYVVAANTPGLNILGQISNTSGGASFTGLLQAYPTTAATVSANQTSTLRLNGYWWDSTANSGAGGSQTYAWNLNTGQNSSGALTQPQLYFYMTGTVPYGVTGSLYYGANGATFANNGGTNAGNSSLNHCYQSSFWPASTNTGSAAYDTWCLQNKIGNTTTPSSVFSISHSVSGGTDGSVYVNMPAMTLGTDTTYPATNMPRLIWSTYGGCSTQYSPCYESALWTPSAGIKITQWTLNFNSAPAGCSTYPVMSIRQGSTAIAAITLTSGTSDYTFGGTLPIAANTGGGALRVVNTTAAVGCSTYATGVNSAIEYVMQ